MAVAAGAGRVWVTTGSDVAEVDASSGRTLRRVATRYPFPLGIGISDGNVWVSSVENGFISGAVTQVPFEAWRARSSPLVMPQRPVLDLAVGSGVTWALAGPWKNLRLVGIDQVTRRTRSVAVRHDLGWIAADNSGETQGLFGVAGDEVVRVRPDGSTRLLRRVRPVGAPAVGSGSVWIASRSTLYRLDAATGNVERSVAVPMASADVAVGGGFAWLLRLRPARGTLSYELLKVDSRSMRIVARRPINGFPGSIAYGNDAVWVGTANSANDVGVVRISPRTLRARTFAIGP